MRVRDLLGVGDPVYEPDALHVVLPCLHIYVYRPDVPSLGMGVDDALEQRFSSLTFA